MVAENRHDSLELTADTTIVGAGGFRVETLALPENGRLKFDPVKTPIYVAGNTEGALVIGAGARFALAEAYSGMTLGRIVLLTCYDVSTLPEDLNSLFDASSIAEGAKYAVTLEDAPDPSGGRRQLVLTVGNYAQDAKEIVVMAAGDSITEGKSNSTQGDNPQYRTAIAAHLAANGYKPKFRGVWRQSNYDAAHVRVPDDWAYHSGFGMAAVRTTQISSGLADNMPFFLDVAGYPDVITVLIGTNDIGGNGKTAEETFAAFVELMNDTAAQRPDAKIVGATLLPRPGEAGEKVVAFNALLKAEFDKEGKGALPDSFHLVDLHPLVPNDIVATDTMGNYRSDNLHPNWKGNAIIAEAFFAKIAEILPLDAFAGAGDATVTDASQVALGAAAMDELAAYRAGMTHVYTIDKNGAEGATNSFARAPYTMIADSSAPSRRVSKVGYFMELVRKGTNRRRWVWVDMDAAGKTLGEVDFPWNNLNMQRVVTKLHVKSNYAGIHDIPANDDSVSGIVEGTMANYGEAAALENAPDDLFGSNNYGWNDTMNIGVSSGGHGCFQVHRIFSQTGNDTHRNDAEVLFAWNCWGRNKSGYVDEIGIGPYFCHLENDTGNKKVADYTSITVTNGNFSDAVTSDAYSVRHVEIWAVFQESPRHGVWSGLGGDADFDNAANWEDGRVPSQGETLDFTALPADTAITIQGDGVRSFAQAIMGSKIVEFKGNVSFGAITDTSKIAVGANSTVTLKGDLELSGSGNINIVYSLAEGGRFVVEGNIVATEEMTGYVYHSAKGGAGAICADGLFNNATANTDAWAFRLHPSVDGVVGHWVIGENGIGGERRFWLEGSHPVNIKAASGGFAVSAWIGNNSELTFDTTGADGNPAVITIGNGASGHLERNGVTYIAGTGKVIVNYSGTSSYYQNSVKVADTATLAVNAGKCPTTTQIEVSAGAALEVAQSGPFNFAGALTLADGAVLGFKFTQRQTAPVLNVSGPVTAQGTVKVKLGGVHPAMGGGSPYLLTAGGKFANTSVAFEKADNPRWVKNVSLNGDGNIVLDIKPAGSRIIVR